MPERNARNAVFANYCKFCPAMLQKMLVERLKSESQDGQTQQKTPETSRKNSFYVKQFKRKQSMGKKRVSFRANLVDSEQEAKPTSPPLKPAYRTVQSQTTIQESETKPTLLPYVSSINSVVLFVDISGFTRLCTKLNPDATKSHINIYFTIMIDIIYRFGGDVHKFIGDAIIVIWPVSDEGGFYETQQTALTALSCAFSLINSECSRYNKTEGGVQVALRSQQRTNSMLRINSTTANYNKRIIRKNKTLRRTTKT